MLETVLVTSLNVRYARDRPWLLDSTCDILKIVPGYYSKRVPCSRPSLAIALHCTVPETVPGY